MEAFSLLKYWRGGGVIGGSEAACGARPTSTTIVAAAARGSTESNTDNAEEEEEDDDDDDGPFFDLEFAVHDGMEEAGGEDAGDCLGEEGVEGKPDNSSGEEEEDGDEGSEVFGGAGEEFNFTLSPSSSSSASSASVDGCPVSPSDDLFFKGRLVSIEPGSSSEPNHNSKPHLPVSLMKSATRLRVFMLGLKKSKADHGKEQEKPEKSQTSGKLLAVKFKVEEVTIKSLFTRDNSSKSQKQATAAPAEEAANNSDEKIFFSKEALQRYLKKVKPLYVRVSKRYGEKMRFSSVQLRKGQMAQPTAAEACGEGVKGQIRQGNIPAGLRVVCKHLGKSRSASSAVAAAPSGSSSSRRDDSLLQQEDGIQSAILHCKRSFNASRGINHFNIPHFHLIYITFWV